MNLSKNDNRVNRKHLLQTTNCLLDINNVPYLMAQMKIKLMLCISVCHGLKLNDIAILIVCSMKLCFVCSVLQNLKNE